MPDLYIYVDDIVLDCLLWLGNILEIGIETCLVCWIKLRGS